MAAHVDENVLSAYQLHSGHIYHIVCGEKAEYKPALAMSGDERWTCKKCDTPDSPWYTDFSLNTAKERGIDTVTKHWVFLKEQELLEEVSKLDFHSAQKDEFENSYHFLRKANQQEVVSWWHTVVIDALKKAREKG